MAQSGPEIRVYLEAGNRRTFAGAIDWPGWCRSGRDEAAALEALVSYGPRYARAVGAVCPDIELPASPSDLVVAEYLQGDSTTDFGAPGAVPTADESPLNLDEHDSLAALMRACWRTFDRAVTDAEGKPLRKGPRGGGRDLVGIVQHVADANKAYLARLAWKPPADIKASPRALVNQMLDESLEALTAAVAGDLPSKGPRGGKLWVPRYFVRRVAWHLLDHAWEIEERVV